MLDDSTWSTKLQELVDSQQVALAPYDLEMNYNHWNYCMYVDDKAIEWYMH